jgi:hypothetical protein
MDTILRGRNLINFTLISVCGLINWQIVFLVVALYIKTEGVVIPPFFSPHFNVHSDQFNKGNLLIL